MVKNSPPKEQKDPGSLKLHHAAASSPDLDVAPLPNLDPAVAAEEVVTKHHFPGSPVVSSPDGHGGTNFDSFHAGTGNVIRHQISIDVMPGNSGVIYQDGVTVPLGNENAHVEVIDLEKKSDHVVAVKHDVKKERQLARELKARFDAPGH